MSWLSTDGALIAKRLHDPARPILHGLRGLDVQIPMVLMTWPREPTLCDVAERAGVSAVLTKPVQIAEVCRIVAALVQQIDSPARRVGARDVDGVR